MRSHSLGYVIREKWHKKSEDLKQDKYARQSDILYKRRGGEKVLFIIMFSIFAIFAFSFIFPFAWILMNAFKTKSQFASDYMGWPNPFIFDNFVNAFKFTSEETRGFNIFQMIGMSIIIAGVGTIVTVFTSSTAAYVVAKYKFPGRGVIFAVVIFSLIVPIVGALPSQIQLMEFLGFTRNNLTRLIGCIFLYSGGFGMNFMLLYSFFKNLSWTYVEAARIDGANDFTIFFRIIIPMAKGPIIAITIIQLIGLWNDYLTPAIYLQDWPTIALGMYYLQEAMLQQSLYTLMFATIILALLPIIILFLIFSKTIMENTSVGGLKG